MRSRGVGDEDMSSEGKCRGEKVWQYVWCGATHMWRVPQIRHTHAWRGGVSDGYCREVCPVNPKRWSGVGTASGGMGQSSGANSPLSKAILAACSKKTRWQGAGKSQARSVFDIREGLAFSVQRSLRGLSNRLLSRATGACYCTPCFSMLRYRVRRSTPRRRAALARLLAERSRASSRSSRVRPPC
ncbi:MAG: hypothetical protein FD177_1118 [Desulfovibrionaceae bacterium]|nr:MAG: hypothetical protein FD177_1118 [Desulfovibrionaceae bacterium]